ncbi:MAG: (4Fe-4S)-binding protein [Proteobacteria bacterium]|jgi:MinD superfamily P-loop ATPase|nr:ATP-binding protein [Alphaproteobacteria bacterium]NCC04136.1 (4Fe-4S)-binding protein [Pseudomonadota bacterium]
MKIAVASGKGGTGKTTLAVNLALAANESVCLLDCDVEAPNAHLFLKGEMKSQRVVTLPVPVVDESRCDGCGLCSQFCAFNAIVSFGTFPVIAPEMCHGCGGCMRVCPQKAIHEIDRRIGVVETLQSGAITLVQGRLDIGVALAPPLIRAVKESLIGNLLIMDAPPGTSCPVIATLRDVDFVLLVTEPTPFGLNDLRLAMDVVRELGLPFGVVINRAGDADEYVRPYLEEERISLLAEIPDDRRIAQAYAKGLSLVDTLPEYRPLFTNLLRQIREAA